MIIDSHTHVDKAEDWGWINPPEVLLPLLDEASIEKAIIMTYRDAVGPDDAPLVYTAEAVASYPDRLIGYARINPQAPAAVEALDEAMTEYGMKGLKLHPVSYVGFPFSEPTVHLIHRAGEYHAPVLFHSGDETMALPEELAAAARLCPDTTIIWAHMGGYFHCEAAIAAAQALPNVMLDTSAMPYPKMIRKAVERVGADRVMYASDGPGCLPALEVEKVRLAGLSPEDEELVMHANIERVLEGVQHAL